MELCLALVDYIAAEAGWEVDVDIHALAFPPDQEGTSDTSVLVSPSGGVSQGSWPITTIGAYQFQVISRAPDPETALANAWQVHDAIHGKAVVALAEWTMHYGDEVQAPHPMGVDSRGRMEYVNHYLIRASRPE